MTINEFRAFLEGMNIKEAPTPEQWARIMEKVAKLDESLPQPITIPVPCPSPAIPRWPDLIWCETGDQFPKPPAWTASTARFT